MTRIRDLKNDVANAQNLTKHWQEAYQRQGQTLTNNYTEISNLRSQVAGLQRSANDLHNHYQREIQKLEEQIQRERAQAVKATLQITETGMRALDTLAAEAGKALDSQKVESAVKLAERQGAYEALTHAFKYLADANASGGHQ